MMLKYQTNEKKTKDVVARIMKWFMLMPSNDENNHETL